eukprot:jgi/Ulvmu1/3355/UM156_0012.1
MLLSRSRIYTRSNSLLRRVQDSRPSSLTTHLYCIVPGMHIMSFSPSSCKYSCRRIGSARSRVCASAMSTPDTRRNVLLAGCTVSVSLAASPESSAIEKATMGVAQLGSFDRVDQRGEVLKRAQAEISKVVTKDDASKAVRLVFNDAATFDVASKTGGMDGSVILNAAERKRPEMAGLDDLVKRLGQAKEVIDVGNAELGSGPISWADLMVLAAKVAVQADWKDIKVSRSAIRSGGEEVAKTFGAAWDVKLGRVDNPDGATKSIVSSSSSTEEARTFMLQLGAKPGSSGPFAPKPPFWERVSFVLLGRIADDPQAKELQLAADSDVFAGFKKSYDLSRNTVTRTNYEVDFINAFNKLTELGAKFDPDAYLHSKEIVRLQ